MNAVDLNADLGEGFGIWRLGDDEAMLGVVTSASVACGFHAGDPETMARTFAAAKEKGVSVGAHVGFPDLYGFGRRPMPFSAGEIERLVIYQLGAAQALARASGHRVAYVKCHGALANLAEADAGAALAVAKAVRCIDASLALLAIALSEQMKAAERMSLRAVSEIYADRAYADDGRLAPRTAKGAVIENGAEASGRVLAMLEERALITASGKRLPARIESICVHGDTFQAVDMARCVRRALQDAGLRLEAFAPA